MPDREKVIEALDCIAHGGGTYDCLKFPCPYGFYGYTDCHKWEIARDALALLKEQTEREKAICKEICDFIRGACSTDTDDDKDFVCYEIQKCFTQWGRSVK